MHYVYMVLAIVLEIAWAIGMIRRAAGAEVPMNDPVILIMMVVTIGVTVGIGIHAYWEARTQQQYFAYGQQLRWFILGLATFSTAMSGFGFVGGPGLVYSNGTTSLWMTFAAALGIPFSFLLVGRRLHALAAPDVPRKSGEDFAGR